MGLASSSRIQITRTIVPLGQKSPDSKKTIARRGPHSTADIKVLSEPDETLEQVESGLYTAAKWIFFAALLGTAIVLLYLFLLIPNVARGVYKDHADQLIGLLRSLMFLLEVALSILGVSFLVLTWDEKKAGGLVASVGVILHVGLPMAIFGLGGRNAVTGALTQGLRNAGFWLVVLGGCKLCLQAFLYCRLLPERMKGGSTSGSRKW